MKITTDTNDLEIGRNAATFEGQDNARIHVGVWNLEKLPTPQGNFFAVAIGLYNENRNSGELIFLSPEEATNLRNFLNAYVKG